MSMDGVRPSRSLTIAEAADRAGRTRSTIELWISRELLDVTVVKNARGNVIRRYVSEADVLSVKRDMLKSNPAHKTRNE